MKIGVVVFPGSNCDHDALHVASKLSVEAGGEAAVPLWHESRDLEGCDALIVPGGFSFGDYLRTGAIARFSPIMDSVRQFAGGGGPVLGICNGFQILCEAGLLPGALLRNAGLHFVCKQIHLRVETTSTPFTGACEEGEVLEMPVAHGDGNYFAAADMLERMRQRRQIVFRYVNAAGEQTPQANPNGSLDGIAGVCNEGRNVVGLMPHPERASGAGLGSRQGLRLFESLLTCQAPKA
ncbi:MAG TPA: phosphoribosylformylglycinamidine synthase subunit PurQ [Terriglobales bacterium]|nr:phosphoribosylformylglycinamidine synthase subunit PurQ [Terriglobales bacterium]